MGKIFPPPLLGETRNICTAASAALFGVFFFVGMQWGRNRKMRLGPPGSASMPTFWLTSRRTNPLGTLPQQEGGWRRRRGHKKAAAAAPFARVIFARALRTDQRLPEGIGPFDTSATQQTAATATATATATAAGNATAGTAGAVAGAGAAGMGTCACASRGRRERPLPPEKGEESVPDLS